jgi:hypothetical protein
MPSTEKKKVDKIVLYYNDVNFSSLLVSCIVFHLYCWYHTVAKFIVSYEHVLGSGGSKWLTCINLTLTTYLLNMYCLQYSHGAFINPCFTDEVKPLAQDNSGRVVI